MAYNKWAMRPCTARNVGLGVHSANCLPGKYTFVGLEIQYVIDAFLRSADTYILVEYAESRRPSWMREIYLVAPSELSFYRAAEEVADLNCTFFVLLCDWVMRQQC